MTLVILTRHTNLSEQFHKVINQFNDATILRPILDIIPMLNIKLTLNTRPILDITSLTLRIQLKVLCIL